MLGKLIFLSTLVCVISLLISIEYTSKIITKDVVPKILDILPFLNDKMTLPVEMKVYGKEELQQFKGKDNSNIYIGLVGHVFDVTKGRKHYGPGGGYEFFAGVDGSKAFVSGDFTVHGLTDDITELTPAEVLGLNGWKDFYEKDYNLVGLVEGSFFDKTGKPQPMMEEYERKLNIAHKEKELVENDKALFPPCNSEWSQAQGGRVWCSTLSGGVSREWTGRPRMYYTAGNSKPRCACVRASGPPSSDPDSLTHSNRGDLDNPNLNLYPNCEATSLSCPLPQQT